MTDQIKTESVFATQLAAVLGDSVLQLREVRGEWTLTVAPADYLRCMGLLKNAVEFQFEQLIDLCGVDYDTYEGVAPVIGRFCVVTHLLSVALNRRLRVKVYCANDDFPVVASVTSLWGAANWYEREAFDLYGIVFEGHDDLRRILTDYGFIGHPFRKDFPLSGHVEMRYDAARQRVIYEPVSIELRENTPRVVREDNYGGLH